MGKPSPHQLDALNAVAAGRVQWGNEYPALARRHGQPNALVFLIDGHGVYASEHNTYARLTEHGLIVSRGDLLLQKTVPAHTRVYTTETGHQEIRQVPEHSIPADDGWRAAVELTAEGARVLGDANQLDQ